MKKQKSLTKNSIYYLSYNVLNAIFPLITGIYVARILLQSDIGQIESAKNLAQYFVILSFLGIPTYGLREISKARGNQNELNKVYSELIVINTISTLIFSIIYYSLILSIPYYKDKIFIYVISGISIILNFLNNTWLFDGMEEFGYTSIRNIIFKTISFILLLVLVRNQEDYIWYLVITVIGTAGNYFLNYFHSKRFVKFTIKDLNLKRHIKPIFFLVAVNLAIEIYSLVDVTMLGFMVDDTSVAIYSYGMKIHKILIQIVNSFTMVLVPRISLYYKENKCEEFNKLVSKTLNIIFLISLPMIIGIFFVSDYIIPAIYGDQYLQSAQVLKILSLILSISPVGYLLGSRMLLVTGHENKMIIAVVAGALTNVIANIIFIHYFNEIGAAIASVVGEIVVMVIYVCLGHKYYKLNKILNNILKETISLSLMIIYLTGISFLQLSHLYITIIQIIGAIVIYLGTLILFKEQNTYAFIQKFIKKNNNKEAK